MLSCPSCQSESVKLNGHIHNGKQNHSCKGCGRQFVVNPKNKVITKQEKVDRHTFIGENNAC